MCGTHLDALVGGGGGRRRDGLGRLSGGGGGSVDGHGGTRQGGRGEAGDGEGKSVELGCCVGFLGVGVEGGLKVLSVVSPGCLAGSSEFELVVVVVMRTPTATCRPSLPLQHTEVGRDHGRRAL